MKHVPALLLAWLVAASAPAQLGYQFNDIAPALGSATDLLPGRTNDSGVLDVRLAKDAAVQVSFTGRAHTTMTVTITNTPGNGGLLGTALQLDGTWTRYAWTNVDGLTVGVPGGYSTFYTLGVTNGDAGADADTISVITSGPRTNVFTITNAPTLATHIQSDTNAPKLATNIFNALSAYFRSFTWSMPERNQVRAVTLTNAVLSMTYTAGYFTNASTTAATLTNTVATNLYFVIAGTNVNTSTTNLVEVLRRDFPQVQVDYTATNAFTIATAASQALTATNAVPVGTVAGATNAANATITGTASNSLDRVTWYRYPNADWTLFVTGTGIGAFVTNYANLGALGYLKFAVGSAATNGAAGRFKLGYAVKPGL